MQRPSAAHLPGPPTTLRPGVVPRGILICSVLLVATFFLRASSIPTGLTSQQLFLACNLGLVCSFVYLAGTHRLAVNGIVFGFVLLTLPSLLASEDGKASGMRWIGWLLVVAVVGPLFSNEVRLKLSVLGWTRKLLLVCAVGSLFLNLAGIRLDGRGVFFGLMGHTMLLAPICALAAIDLFTTGRYKKSRLQTVLLILCCITCIGAGSRGAVIGLTVGILTHVAHRKEGLIVVCIAAVALGLVSFVQLTRVTTNKGKEIGGGGVYAELAKKGTNDTRTHLWAARIKEYTSSPVNGVGFQQQRIFRIDTDEKFLEPGSGYLAVLSMTGTLGGLGFVCMIAPLYMALFSRYSAIPDSYRDVLRGWLAFFAIHFIIEGYIFACGSLLCFLFWLTAGCSLSLHHQGRRLLLRQRLKQQARIEERRLAAA